MTRGGLLLCFAHPDDESVFAAGVACRHASGGGRVLLVTATRGESGKSGDPPVCARDQLGEVRERELGEAARIIGVSSLHLLGYRDRELSAAPPEAVRDRLVSIIRRERPAVVVTFDPNGTNLHPDHIAISRFTSDAIAAAADPRWVPETGPSHRVDRLVWVPRRPWEVLRSGRPADHPGVDFLVDVRAWSERKSAALRAHRSQHLSTERIFFDHDDQALTLGYELFRQAWGPPLSAPPASDLWQGLSSLEQDRQETGLR